MKKLILAVALILLAGLAGSCFAGGTYSGQAVQESLNASSHASVGVMYGIVASGQAVSAVAAVPFAIAGTAGAVSTGIAVELMNAATTPVGAPLPITDENLTAGPPPDEALKGEERNRR
ncbi:MAG: hypothetical protein AB2L11_10130 [Syntrophobacteraceae bacterium]